MEWNEKNEPLTNGREPAEETGAETENLHSLEDRVKQLTADNGALRVRLEELQKENTELSMQVGDAFKAILQLQAKTTAIEYWTDVAARSKPLDLAQYFIQLKHALKGTREEKDESRRWLRGDRGFVPKFHYIQQIAARTKELERDLQAYVSRQADQTPLELRGCEYKFFRFLKKKNERFSVDFSQFAVPHVKGLVSVILPVYNGEDLIEESIRSVLAQSYEHFELIIVDDGSTDQTPHIVDRWSRQDQRIRVIHQQNSKLPRALNCGFSHAKGEFLTWTSADNNMHRDFLEKLVDYLQRNPKLAMCYANIRVIDGHGAPIMNDAWYSSGEKTGDVRLPDAALRLNTYPENTVGAAFMYRRAVPLLLGGYDPQLYTVEDYEYWMRINDYFGVRHTDFEDVIYDYRVHENSLTAKAKELHINELRERLMLTEDYRQDWILRPMCWLLRESDAPVWRAHADAAGHISMTREEAGALSWPRLGTGVVQLTMAEGGAPVLPDERVTWDAIRVLVRKGEPREEDQKNFDFLVQIGRIDESVPEGWIRAADEKSAFDLIQIFCKSRWFEQMMRVNRDEKAFRRKATLVLCTYKRVDSAVRALQAMMEQTTPQADYEILVVNNDPGSDEMRKAVAEKRSACKTEGFLRYVDCPYPGLSSARNCALYEAEGEAVMFVDDDGIMEPKCLERIIGAFHAHPASGVIGGQIILNQPEAAAGVVLRGYEGIWSEHRFSQNHYFETENDAEYPYGCNYAIRRDLLRELGGFRIAYGRMGKDFSGGEEMVLSHLVRKSGMRIGIEPEAVVLHDVDPSRFTLNHIRQTMRAGRLTNRQMKMDFYKEFDPWMREEYFLLGAAQERMEKLKSEGMDESDLNMFYCQCDLEATRQAIDAGQKDLMVMRWGVFREA